MLKAMVSAAAAALLAGAAQAAAPGAAPLAWIIVPGDGACRTELELTGRSGASVPITLSSDGAVVSLRFRQEELPERAFLPIRIDQKRYSNLMLRSPDAHSGELILSEESEAALRRGASLAVAWLGEEPLSGSLAGSGPGVADLKTCGAQAATQARARASADAAARAQAEAEGRAKAVADAQVEAARAQAAAAEAERQRVADAAERQRRQEAADQERAYAEQRQREYEAAEARQRGYQPGPYEDDDPRYAPPPPQPYYPPAYGYGRY